MQRREFLIGSAAALTAVPLTTNAGSYVSRPIPRDDPETRTVRRWIGLSIGAALSGAAILHFAIKGWRR